MTSNTDDFINISARENEIFIFRNPVFYMLLNDIAMDKAVDVLDTEDIFHSCTLDFLCDFTAINGGIVS